MMTERILITGADSSLGRARRRSCSPTARSPRSVRGHGCRGRDDRSTPTGSSPSRASSTCTPISASPATSRARRCSLARRPLPPVDSRPCSRWRTRSRSPTPQASSNRRCRSAVPPGTTTVQPVGAVTVGLKGEQLAELSAGDGPVAGERSCLLRRRLLRVGSAAHAPRPRVREGLRRRHRAAPRRSRDSPRARR